MSSSQNKNASRVRAAAIAATISIWSSSAFAETSTNTAGPVQQGQSGSPAVNNPAITISFSGQTALRNFDTSSGITLLDPAGTYSYTVGSTTYVGNKIVLHTGLNGAPVTYFIPNVTNAGLQLANKDFTVPDTNPGTPTSPSVASSQTSSAIRLEWHEQGSIDGFYDLVNDEVGYSQTGTATPEGNPAGPISNPAARGPSLSNPTWINQGSFTAGTGTTAVRGFLLDNSTTDTLANTYDATVYNQTTGVNIQHGQNRIQFAVGEPAIEAVSNANGVATYSTNTAGSGGYGLGNPALVGPSASQQASGIGSLTALGAKGARQQFQPATILNESNSIVNPNSGTSATYDKGPWNSGTINNVTSTDIAVTAVTLSANPGTGLSRVNKGDAQWLQTTGRLQNGALFNVVARTVDTGQRVVLALNTGVDPSWAVGSNDDGNTTVTSTNTSVGTLQDSIGSALRFSGKTSGTLAERTIASSRMSLGALSLPEAGGTTSTSAAPVRTLSINFTDLNDANPNSVDQSRYVSPSFNSIVSNGQGSLLTGNAIDNTKRYEAVLISHYNTIKAPSLTALNNELTHEGLPTVASVNDFQTDGSNNVFTSNLTSAQLQTAWKNVTTFDPATAQTDSTPTSASVSGIKGDKTGDVAAFISNIVNSAGSAAAGLNTSSVKNPADNLFVNGFLIPSLLDYTRQTDGGPITPVTLSTTAAAEQTTVRTNYGFNFTTDNTNGAGTETIGSGAHYGDGGLSYNGLVVTAATALNGGNIINITAKDSDGKSVSNGVIAPAGNYLFGNFNQNGVRDYSAVLEAVDAALSLHNADGVNGKNSIFTSDGGGTNGLVVHALTGSPAWDSHQDPTTHIGLANTKGDLITLGDYNGDGKFDGQDIYLLAKGASLADNNGTTTLTATATTFADAVRNPNAVLRKNAALTYINNTLLNNPSNTDQQFLRTTARAVLTSASVPSGATDLGTNTDGTHNYTFDPTGVNAFNKFDVNRDGLVNRRDAQIVDYFAGQNYHDLSNTLGAVVRTDLNAGGTAFVGRNGAPLDPTAAGNASIPRRQISLVDVELNDTGDISQTADFALIRAAIGSSLLDGDANFDGVVNALDFNALATNYGATNDKWSQGDFSLDGTVGSSDFDLLAAHFGQVDPLSTSVADAAFVASTLVPEPGTIPAIVLAAGAMLGYRRRRAT